MKLLYLSFIVIIISVSPAYGHYLLGSGKDYSLNDDCVTYYNDLIEICGGEFDIQKLYSYVDNNNLLYEEEDKVWVLNSSLSIGLGTKLILDDIWLKILDNKQNHIEVRGELIINRTKITSWDPATNNYSLLEHVNDYRPHIVVLDFGSLKIINSFIGYLGYDASRSHGLDFYEGRDHIIINSTIVGNYFGAYTDKVDSMIIMNNEIHDNYVYGLDPHTYSKNIKIVNNTVYNNGYHGIICSRFCENIEIINNKVYNNIGHGIMLDRNVTNSIVSNNTIINNDSGVMLFSSNNNTISSNIINDNKHGIKVSYGSSYNTINNNIINNSRTYGIYLLKNAYQNVIRDNIIINVDDSAIYIDDAESSSNYIINNIIKSVTHYNIRLRDADVIMLNNRYACNDICIYLDNNNSVLHINDNLYNMTYRSKGNNHIKIIDENNYIYSNSLKIPQIVTSNSSILEFNIEHDNLMVNREDVSIIASNPLSVMYDDVIYINANTLTDIKINGKNYYLTDYVKFDDGIYTINGNVILYNSCDVDMLKIGINKYMEVCSYDHLIKQIPNYLYSTNTVILILLGFSILSFILIVKKR
ncbi:MAG: hypothetical protein KatS3mg003_1009 [Candidatus Nitrosocaldaceae archaeon]|nr:MAG: hypothetical protein KatS3mg003_1009 [Candidatus Nitrosocaldaceae archaeon]